MTSSDPAHRRLWLIALVAALAGCGYGPVSPAAYEHAKGLYTLANMKAEASLGTAEAAIAADAESGAISDAEQAWLTDICADCRAGDWKSATAAARKIMEDQVKK